MQLLGRYWRSTWWTWTTRGSSTARAWLLSYALYLARTGGKGSGTDPHLRCIRILWGCQAERVAIRRQWGRVLSVWLPDSYYYLSNKMSLLCHFPDCRQPVHPLIHPPAAGGARGNHLLLLLLPVLLQWVSGDAAAVWQELHQCCSTQSKQVKQNTHTCNTCYFKLFWSGNSSNCPFSFFPLPH